MRGKCLAWVDGGDVKVFYPAIEALRASQVEFIGTWHSVLENGKVVHTPSSPPDPTGGFIRLDALTRGYVTSSDLWRVNVVVGETDTQWFTRMIADKPAGVIVDIASLPPRRFRSAFEIVGNQLVVSISAARLELLRQVREERDGRLRESDHDKARLDDTGTNAQKQTLREYRQELRDLLSLVETQIATMNVSQMVVYQPPWPVLTE